MQQTLITNKLSIKAAILKGETYASVASRYGVQPLDVHRLLRSDPDIETAKANGTLRGRGKQKQTLDECLADPAVHDVIVGGLSTSAAARKHGLSQPALWVKVRRAKDLQAPTTTPPKAPSPDAALIAEMAKSLAAKGSLTPRQLLEAASQLLTA